MKCFFDEIGHACALQLKGEFTADHVDSFRRSVLGHLDEHRVADFIVDCSELEYVDSQGLESLLWLTDLCAERLGQIRLVRLSEPIKTVLHITRLAGRLPVHDDVNSALASLE
ncbi:MAG: STAS domain-containing protein [Phycisphaeraceae bacterium]|nr:STAS domain-containing protein [Phycisphaeraceae bacterium]